MDELPRRDCPQAIRDYEEFFKHTLRKLNHDPHTAISINHLPVTRIKRIMKQESCYAMRQISRDAAPLMAYAVQLFIGLVTNLAWHRSAKPASRNTLMLKDLLHVYGTCRKFDFLIDIATPLTEMPLRHWPGEGAKPSSNAETTQRYHGINEEPNEYVLKSHAETFDDNQSDEVLGLIAL